MAFQVKKGQKKKVLLKTLTIKESLGSMVRLFAAK
jgi:hypothetical protein